MEAGNHKEVDVRHQQPKDREGKNMNPAKAVREL